ncbi:MAG TPA: Ku protein [Saprospiraceae bacterium]|nr:Ku protein [Saprospiraceae bacterium]
MRAIWKGFIQFSLVNIPIKLYSAIEAESTVSFRQLHKDDNGPVGYDKVCKTCESKLSASDIVKGYEYEPGQYVIVEDGDLENIRLKSTKVIEIEAFVDVNEVHHTLFDAPYFIGPDGEVAAKAYHLLMQTLKSVGKLAIGRVVLRDREHVVMISPYESGMMMYKLRYPDEIRDVNTIPQLAESKIGDDQLKLAKTLVETMTKPFSELELKDRYREALVEMIHAKVEGKQIVQVGEETAPVVDIMTALKESIEMAKSQKKPMKKATGQAKEQVAEKKAKKAG